MGIINKFRRLYAWISIFSVLFLLTWVFYLVRVNFGEAWGVGKFGISGNGMFSETHYQVAMKGLNKTGIRKVVIGAVCCRSAAKKDNMKFNEETVTMMKSVVISAKLYNISEVEFHLFLELEEDGKYFLGKFKEMGYRLEDIRVILYIHSAVSVVPEQYWDHMIYHPRFRCGYVRFFFPSALPNVDSIIHLDSDMVITGNLWEIWSQLNSFEGDQLIGAARSNEVHDIAYLEMTQNWFGDIPYPPPRGINAGLLIMNLTKMREYQWEQKFLQVYDNYSKKVTLTGQRTVNILFGATPEILKMLSCKYNFFHRHCDRGYTCLDAIAPAVGGEPRGGIHLVHGNGQKFEKNKLFHPIYQAYQHFRISTLGEDMSVIKANLMTPIRKFYSRTGPCLNKCFGTLSHILFRDHFKDEDSYFNSTFFIQPNITGFYDLFSVQPTDLPDFQ